MMTENLAKAPSIESYSIHTYIGKEYCTVSDRLWYNAPRPCASFAAGSAVSDVQFEVLLVWGRIGYRSLITTTSPTREPRHLPEPKGNHTNCSRRRCVGYVNNKTSLSLDLFGVKWNWMLQENLLPGLSSRLGFLCAENVRHKGTLKMGLKHTEKINYLVRQYSW